MVFATICFLIGIGLLIESIWRRRSRAALLILIPVVTGVVAFGVEVSARLSGHGIGIGTGTTVMRGALLAVCAILIRRWIRANRALESSNRRFAMELEQAQTRLRETLLLHHQREQRAMLQQERENMMRELHDGLGNQLISGMALCAMHPDTTPEIEDVLRDAMGELRLVLTAMSDLEGDLAGGIASFLPQLRRQVRPFGIALECDVADLPPLPWLRPAHMQQILRIVQESVMNAAKHSGSPIVRIEGSADRPCLTVRDYGCGGAADRGGSFGLAIMRSRAISLGADLHIASDGNGTVVTLALDPAGGLHGAPFVEGVAA
jgi:signal transduction histidine kinase